MDTVDVDGTPFSILMDRAVKLKTLQTRHHREKFDGLPSFYSNSIFPQEDAVRARRVGTSFEDRLAEANRMKYDGNAAYRDGRSNDALAKYETALSVFRFLENTNPHWKTEGIKDQFVKEHAYECKNDAERESLRRFLSSCYNNVALVSIKMCNFSLAMKACDYAIEVDAGSDKSFYLRAKARITPKSSDAADQALAASDLRTAMKSNPENNEVRNLLQRLESQTKMQRRNDRKTFKGLFDRGEVYDARELEEEKEIRRRTSEEDRIESRNRDIIVGKQLARAYEERGMEDEKQRIVESVRREERSMSVSVDGTTQLGDVDFHNPSMSMLEDARSWGVDLKDPLTVELLTKMRDEK